MIRTDGSRLTKPHDKRKPMVRLKHLPVEAQSQAVKGAKGGLTK